jgi:hypothetical protein
VKTREGDYSAQYFAANPTSSSRACDRSQETDRRLEGLCAE